MFLGYSSYMSNKFDTDPDYKEIIKLDTMLTEHGIPHTLDPLYDGWQVCYPSKGESLVMDAIEHYGSYGSSEDKLEIMGLLTPEEEAEDSVLGHLTADEVFMRIQKHCESIQNMSPTYAHITEIIDDFHKVVEKAKTYGLDIKLTPNSNTSLELYFHDDYPDTILVDKAELSM